MIVSLLSTIPINVYLWFGANKVLSFVFSVIFLLTSTIACIVFISLVLSILNLSSIFLLIKFASLKFIV
nr:hypothetical protein [Ureaplasma parvum]